MSTPSLDVTNVELYGASPQIVRLSDKQDAEVFKCEEEPHMLGSEHGFGYFPKRIGQLLGDGKLEIVRKLGWGGYASVWLARAERGKYPSRYVAVKVLSVNSTALAVDKYIIELSSLSLIRKTNPNHPGYKHCLQRYEYILETSLHGPHICIVTNVLGKSMMDLKQMKPKDQRYF